MLRRIYLLFLILILFSSGCAFWRHHHKDSEAKRIIDDGRIVQEQRLRSGGNLLIEPFYAGVGVAATEQLDRVALMMVRGVADAFKEQEARIKVLSADNAGKADLIMRGRIVEMTATGGMKKWVMRKKKKTLRVQGEVFDQETGEVVVYFSHSKEALKGERDFEELALTLGKDIGQFMTGKGE